jgi:hypothetical protein
MVEIIPDEDDSAAIEVKDGSTKCCDCAKAIAQISSEETCSPYLRGYKLPEDELRYGLIKCCDCKGKVTAQVSAEEIYDAPYPYQRKSRLCSKCHNIFDQLNYKP